MITTPCDEWTGARNAKGYGRVWRDGKVKRVHRVVWEDAYGPIPPGMKILHHCDNPPCKRLDHLFIGTTMDNYRDMVAKGRRRAGGHGGGRSGERHPMARLTAQDVETIRQLANSGGQRRALAKRFGISRGHLYRIITGTAWKASAR